MQYRVTLSRKQRVHTYTALSGQLLEASAVQFVCNKNVTLFRRQLVKSIFEFGQQHVTDVHRIGPRIGRRQQIFEPKCYALFFALDRGFRESHGLLLAEEVRDAIARNAKEPAGDVLDWHQQPVGLHQFVEHLLQDVLGIGWIRYTPADEVPQPRTLLRDHFGDLTVLLKHYADAHDPHLQL